MKKAIKVYFVDKKTIKKIPNKNLVNLMNFDGSYKSTLFDQKNLSIYIGTELKKIKTIDPFYKIDYYSLGGTLAKIVKGTELKNLILQPALSKTKPTSKNILDFFLGLKQGLWKFDKYKKTNQSDIVEIDIDNQLKRVFTKEDQKKLNALNKGISLTRFVIEETPEEFNPTTATKIIKKELESYKKIKIKIFDEKSLHKNHMNAILTVGRASIHKPTMIHVTLKPKQKSQKTICLVGKGLTYDSGGLDVKPGGHMKGMKMDMGGSGTLFGVIKTLAELNQLESTKIHWISPFVENSIGPNSYRPDDVITEYSGQTIEIHNTDAEGRLVLSDSLAYATLLNPDYIVDLATLTGMCVHANSSYYTGLMSNDKNLANSLIKSFEKNGEMTVNNPLPEILRKQVKGSITDLKNLADSREAGHLTAGLFLSHFVDQNNFRNKNLKIKDPKSFAWAHLDIAGSAYNKGQNQLDTKGATGQSVRGLVDWIINEDKD